MYIGERNFLALTATAQDTTRETVIEALEMKDCVIINCKPNKLNIKFSVLQKPCDPMEILSPILQDICDKGVKSERRIIFCRTYEDTLQIFELCVLFLHKRNAFYTTVGDQSMPNFSRRICDKYDARTALDVKKSIIDLFTDADGNLRLVIATVAFAMGLDAPNIRSPCSPLGASYRHRNVHTRNWTSWA